MNHTIIKSNLKITLILLLFVSNLFARNTTVNLDHIDIDTFLNELQPKVTVTLCKDQANTLENYISCLETNAKDNPTIENINFLAKIYASYQMYDKAIQTYEINVKKNDKEATYYLASIYNEALKQHDIARPYFEKIKEYKDSTCQIGGIVSVTKDETPFNFINEYLAKRRTFKYYDSEIEQGNIKAYGCKGLYHNKFEEYDEAEKLFLKGLEKGDKQNLFYLGNLYDYYLIKIPQAMEYYEKSYKAGNDQAAHNLGFMYEARDKYEKAIKWYIPSVKRGDLKSLINLGNIYRVNKYEETALKIYKKAGNLGSWYGNEAVWVFYSKAKRFEEGIAYLKDRFNRGYKECARLIGRIYKDHLKEYEKAIQWYKKGYIAGDSRSAFNLGYLYDVELKEYDKAIEWYKKASVMGNIDATYNIGYVYEKMLNNKEEAIKWYKKSYKMNKNMDGYFYQKIEKKLKQLGVLDE